MSSSVPPASSAELQKLFDETLRAKETRDYVSALALFRQSFDIVPEAFLSINVWSALFNAPDWFEGDDEADAYLDYAEAIMVALREKIATVPKELGYGLAQAFVSGAWFRHTTHNTRRLTEFMAHRAALFRIALEVVETPMDYVFPTPVSRGGKLRYGILLKHLVQDPETIGALSYFEFAKSPDVEVLVFVVGPNQNAGFAARVRAVADQVTVLSEDLVEIVQTLREADLDILFFANDVSAKSSVPAFLTFFRVARCTFTCVATIATSAAPHLDVYLGAEYFKRKGFDDEFTERFVPLPFPGFSFSIPVKTDVDESILRRDNIGIPKDAILLTSGANFTKLHGPLLRCWAEILKQVPEAYLVVYPFPPHFGPAQADWVRRWAKLMGRAGADLSRIKFLPSLGSRDAVIALLKNADVSLDSFPYSGLTTIVDAIEAHLPVVVPSGPRLRNNHAAAIMDNIGAPELIATSTEDYIARTVALARDPAQRAAWRERLAAVMAGPPDFLNPPAYCKAVLGALWMLYNEMKDGVRA